MGGSALLVWSSLLGALRGSAWAGGRWGVAEEAAVRRRRPRGRQPSVHASSVPGPTARPRGRGEGPSHVCGMWGGYQVVRVYFLGFSFECCRGRRFLLCVVHSPFPQQVPYSSPPPSERGRFLIRPRLPRSAPPRSMANTQFTDFARTRQSLEEKMSPALTLHPRAVHAAAHAHSRAFASSICFQQGRLGIKVAGNERRP